MTTVLARLAVLVAVLFGYGVLVPTTASASCAAGSGPAGSQTIFVGTAREDRLGFTRFDVDRVIAGPDLAPSIWVLSGQRQSPWPGAPRVSSSADASFELGVPYVVGAYDFRTDACNVAGLGDDVRRDVGAGGGRAPRADGATGAPQPFYSLHEALVVAGPWGGLRFVADAFWGV